ncbi:MAG: hypothetical protein V1826_02645 [bacterium]
MSDIDEILEPGEKIERTYRRHWFNLVAPVVWSMAMLLPLVVINLLLSNLAYGAEPAVKSSLWLFGGAYLVFVTSFLMMQWIIWYLDVWFITRNQLMDIQLVSLFNRQISQVALNQVQDVRVDIKGLLASVLDYGDLTVESAGREGFFQLRSIPHPHDVARTIREFCEAYRQQSMHVTMSQVSRPTERLGDVLIDQGKLVHHDLMKTLAEQQLSGQPLGQILLREGLISREDLVQALGHQYHMPSIDLSRYEIDANLIKQLPAELARKYTVIPVSRSLESMTLAIADPSPDKVGELASQMDIPLAFMVADEDYIKEAIIGYYASGARPSPNSHPPEEESPSPNVEGGGGE